MEKTLFLITDSCESELAVIIKRICKNIRMPYCVITTDEWTELMKPVIEVHNNRISTSILFKSKRFLITEKATFILLNFPFSPNGNIYPKTEKNCFQYGFFDLVPALVLNKYSVLKPNHVMDQVPLVKTLSAKLRIIKSPLIKISTTYLGETYQPWPEFNVGKNGKKNFSFWQVPEAETILLMIYLNGSIHFFDIEDTWKEVLITDQRLINDINDLSVKISSVYYEALIIKGVKDKYLLYIDSAFHYVYFLFQKGYKQLVIDLFTNFLKKRML